MYANGLFQNATVLAYGNVRTYLLGVQQQVQLQLFRTASVNVGSENSGCRPSSCQWLHAPAVLPLALLGLTRSRMRVKCRQCTDLRSVAGGQHDLLCGGQWQLQCGGEPVQSGRLRMCLKVLM